MKPIKLPLVWQRRFYEASFLISLTILGLATSSLLGLLETEKSTIATVVLIVLSSLVSIACVVFYLLVQKSQKVRESYLPMLSIFTIIFATVTYMTYSTGGISSPYIPLWTVLALFSGIFGALGWISVVVIAGIAIALTYLNGGLSSELMTQMALTGLLPAIISAFAWREDSGAIDEISRNTKNLASELSEVAAKSEIIINAIGDGVIAVDGKGTVELINPAAQKILGISKQDALVLNYKSVLKLNDENNNELEPSNDPVMQVLNTNQQTRNSKLTALTKSGKRIAVAIVVSPIGETGSGAIAVFRDVTKERSEEREQAEFISTASHEMRTPVASIEGYLGLAMNPTTAQIDDRAKDYINKAHESAQHLGRLFQDLLDVSKSEDGRMTSTPKVVDVTHIAESVTQGLSQKAAEKGLDLIFRPSHAATGQKKILPVFNVNQDNDHIREVLDNLVENAIKYTPSGEVIVDIDGTEDKVIISVKDSGLGIPAEDMPHLFQKFYRVDNVDRQEIGGTGLGLYLSRRLAESMQGRLWAESEYQKGSTFFLEIPRIDNAEAAKLKEQQDANAAMKLQQQTVPQQFTTVNPAPAQQPTQAPAIQQPPTQIQPATTVPRGESLSEAQKAEQVRRLEELAKQQRESQI